MRITALLLASIACTAQGVIDTTMCEVGANPAKFDGMLIRVRARHASGFELSVLSGCNPNVEMWFTDKTAHQFPKGGVAPVQQPEDIRSPEKLTWRLLPRRRNISLVSDAGARALDAALEAQRVRAEKDNRRLDSALVTATFIGRFDWLGGRLVAHRAAGSREVNLIRGGFGHLNGWTMQFVVHRISDVESTPQ